jgi:hypothetical protein
MQSLPPRRRTAVPGPHREEEKNSIAIASNESSSSDMWTRNLSLESDLAREAAPDFQVSCCDRLHASRPKSVGLYTPRDLREPARLSWSAYLEMVVGSQAGLVLSK